MTPNSEIRHFEAQVSRRADGGLSLAYRLCGAIAALKLPTGEGRTDKLWEHTCFEAFLRAEGAEAYVELNFAPEAQWAAYRFTSLRTGMRNLDIAPPRIGFLAEREALTLDVELSPLPLPHAAWACALSAVLEDAAGAKTYWALAHPGDKPDFHHPAAFTLALPPEGQT
jgi:hypothetical protein